jgi:alpha-ketoglutaric semialdehyde dehydrogenase
MVQFFKHFVDGKFQAESKDFFADVSPTNGRTVARFSRGTDNDIVNAVESADGAFLDWKDTPAPVRAKIVFRAAQLMEKFKERLSRELVLENGKIISEARGDVQEAIDLAYYAAGEGRRLFGETTKSELRNRMLFTIRQPLGRVALITPFNFPAAIPAWKVFPAIVAGNTCVLKPAEDAPLLSMRLVEFLVKSGLPKGVVNVVNGFGEEIGSELINHELIDGVSFTGSREVGSLVMQQCGRHVKHCSLELGGKNPVIVMDDANLDLALDAVMFGAFGTCGQRCTATSRLIVHEKIKQKLLQKLLSRTRSLKLGDPLLAKTDVGPLINLQALEKVSSFSQIGELEGASLLCGGSPSNLKQFKNGFFFNPTIFDDVSPDMRIAREEIFGPVLSVLSFSELDEAIKIANGVDFGLSASIFTNDLRNAFYAIERIECGVQYVNSATIGAEIQLPFGGVKRTGNGFREAGSEAIKEFTEIKSVFIDYSGKLQKAQIDTEK